MVFSAWFLTHYYVQNSNLLKCSLGIPFLSSALEDLLRGLMEKFVLKDDSGRKLLKINPQDVNIQNQLSASK